MVETGIYKLMNRFNTQNKLSYDSKDKSQAADWVFQLKGKQDSGSKMDLMYVFDKNGFGYFYDRAMEGMKCKLLKIGIDKVDKGLQLIGRKLRKGFRLCRHRVKKWELQDGRWGFYSENQHVNEVVRCFFVLLMKLSMDGQCYLTRFKSAAVEKFKNSVVGVDMSNSSLEYLAMLHFKLNHLVDWFYSKSNTEYIGSTKIIGIPKIIDIANSMGKTGKLAMEDKKRFIFSFAKKMVNILEYRKSQLGRIYDK